MSHLETSAASKPLKCHSLYPVFPRHQKPCSRIAKHKKSLLLRRHEVKVSQGATLRLTIPDMINFNGSAQVLTEPSLSERLYSGNAFRVPAFLRDDDQIACGVTSVGRATECGNDSAIISWKWLSELEPERSVLSEREIKERCAFREGFPAHLVVLHMRLTTIITGRWRRRRLLPIRRIVRSGVCCCTGRSLGRVLAFEVGKSQRHKNIKDGHSEHQPHLPAFRSSFANRYTPLPNSVKMF